MSLISQNDEWVVHVLKSSSCFDCFEKWVVVKFSHTTFPGEDCFLCYGCNNRGGVILKEIHKYEELELPGEIVALELKVWKEVPDNIKHLLPSVEEYLKNRRN